MLTVESVHEGADGQKHKEITNPVVTQECPWEAFEDGTEEDKNGHEVAGRSTERNDILGVHVGLN